MCTGSSCHHDWPASTSQSTKRYASSSSLPDGSEVTCEQHAARARRSRHDVASARAPGRSLRRGSGVEPQQPPTIRTPCSTYRATCSASISGPGLVDDLGADDLRHAGVRLHPHGNVAGGGEDLGHDEVGILERAPAVRADGRDAERDHGCDRIGRAQAHHRPRAHVEAERDDERQVRHALDALDGPDRLLDGEDRLEHEQVDAAVCERLRLLGVRRDGCLAVQQPVRLDQLPRRAERPGHEPACARALARELGGAEVHLAGPSDAAGPR